MPSKPDYAEIVGLIVIGAVSALAVLHGGPTGLTVAAGGIGAIGGWLTKGAVSQKAASITNTANASEAQP